MDASNFGKRGILNQKSSDAIYTLKSLTHLPDEEKRQNEKTMNIPLLPRITKSHSSPLSLPVFH